MVCITDADPTKKEREPEGSNIKRWKKCYPFELNQNIDEFEYKSLSTHVDNLIEFKKLFENIEVYTPPRDKGKTLEYYAVFEHNFLPNIRC